jgi:pimeloyl-ACP methyl ester carboxylesterase
VDPSFVSLPDGRRLAYGEYGDLGGCPVVNCHGGLTSRRDAERCADVAKTAGVRVISPDRPGIGRSDPSPGRTLLDWPSDVAELTDALGIGRFAVLGWSAGGPYAAACCFALADRVTAAALVASGIPGDWPGMRREINRMDRVMLRLADRAPWAASSVLRSMALTARGAPALFRRLSGVSLDQPSRRVVGAGSARAFADPMAEGLRSPPGVIEDYRILGAPWGFDPSALDTPVTIWQGDEDALVPPSWGARLAAAIPDADLHVCAGQGHFLPSSDYERIYDALASAG